MTAPIRDTDTQNPAVTLAKVKVIAAGYGMPAELIDALVSSAVAVERARVLNAADQMVFGPRQGPPMRPTFEECRRQARRLLGDAADQIRAGDWQPLPTRAQRDAVARAIRLIGEAEDALDEAAFMDTIDLAEEDR